MGPDVLNGFRLGQWTVEPLKGAITGPDGESHHLQPKVMDVLVCLATNADQPVTRDELLSEVWGDHAVSDEPLTRAIGELRRALHDERGNPTYIETIPKRGYRLIGSVIAAGSPVDPAASFSDVSIEVDQLLRRPILLAGFSGLLAIAFVLMLLRLVGQGEDLADIPANSIAVLPFLSCDDEDDSMLFVERITDEVRNRLAQIDAVTVSYRTAKQLAVVARTSSLVFWEARLEPAQIGRELRVRYLLNAEVCEHDGNLVTAVSLIDYSGYLVQSKRFEQQIDDSFPTAAAVAQTVSTAVADWLGATPATLALVLIDPEARELFELAQQHYFRGNTAKAQTAAAQALLVQPDFAPAIFLQALMELRGLDLDQRDGLEKALQLAETALRPALHAFLSYPEAFETNFVVGHILASMAAWEDNLVWRSNKTFDQEQVNPRYAEAESYLSAATTINPSISMAAELLADVVDAQGRKSEALAILEKALLTDPFNIDLNVRIVRRWEGLGRYREAIKLLQRFERLPDPPVKAWFQQLEIMQIHGYWDDKAELLIDLLINHPDVAAGQQIRFQASWFVGDLLHLGLYEEAEAWRARLFVGDLPDSAQLLAERFYLWGKGDQEELTRRSRERLATMTDKKFVGPWYNTAMNWAWDIAEGGDTERAIEFMDKLKHAPTLRDERDILPSLLLARLYVRADRKVDADAILARISDHLENEVASGVVHPESLFRLAEVYSLQNHNESAIHVLQMAIDNHWRMPWWKRPWTTDLNGLDSNPRVAELRDQVETDLQNQADRIRTMLAGHDADELLAPLMAGSH